MRICTSAPAPSLWTKTHAVAPADAEIVGDKDRRPGSVQRSTDVILAMELPPSPIAVKMTKRSQFVAGGRMSSLRQIEANRRNARLSTGPVTEEGKRRWRQGPSCLRDYAAFEMAVTADCRAQSPVERELVSETGKPLVAAASRHRNRERSVQDPSPASAAV
jgi:hypothetical protein